MQDDSAPLVGTPIQLYELDGTAQQSQAKGRDLVHAWIGVMKALNRHVVRVFDPDRKDTHWGKRKLKRV